MLAPQLFGYRCGLYRKGRAVNPRFFCSCVFLSHGAQSFFLTFGFAPGPWVLLQFCSDGLLDMAVLCLFDLFFNVLF